MEYILYAQFDVDGYQHLGFDQKIYLGARMAKPLLKGKSLGVMQLKGGTGKTTVTINMAATASKKGWNVVILDVDQSGQLTDLVLGKFSHEINATEALRDIQNGDQIEHHLLPAKIVGSNVFILPMSPTEIPSGKDIHDGENLMGFIPELITEVKNSNVDGKPVDLVLVDIPGAEEDILKKVLEEIDYVAMPMSLAALDLSAAQKTMWYIKEFQKMQDGNPKFLGVILNHVEKGESDKIIASESEFIRNVIDSGTLLPIFKRSSMHKKALLKEDKSGFIGIPNFAPNSPAGKRVNLLWDVLNDPKMDRTPFKKELEEYLDLYPEEKMAKEN